VPPLLDFSSGQAVTMRVGLQASSLPEALQLAFDALRVEGALDCEFTRAGTAGRALCGQNPMTEVSLMPYETTITGEFAINPPLAAAHLAYLLAFSRTRHMRCATRALKKRPDPLREAAGLPLGRGGAYYVGGLDLFSQSLATVTNSLQPPHGQPSLYCKWTPTTDGRALVWQGSGAHYEEWLEYLMKHFLLPWGYVLCGRVEWQGKRPSDSGVIRIEENILVVIDLEDRPGYPRIGRWL
jgi:hypothetical protein